MSYFRQRFGSFRYAWLGLKELWRSTPNARIHVAIASVTLLLSWYFSLTAGEWGLVVLCIGGVLAAEAFNSALENLTDLASPEIHPLAGKAKDLAAAAVLLWAATSVVIGVVIFLPKFIEFLN
jgi:diacylglycerol kinase